MLMFGRTRSHSYTINIAGHITVMRNYLKFCREFGYHGSLTAQLNSPTQKTRPLIEQAKLATIVQKLTEKVLKLLNYLDGNCTKNCLGNQSWPKILGGKLRGLGGSFPPPPKKKVPG